MTEKQDMDLWLEKEGGRPVEKKECLCGDTEDEHYTNNDPEGPCIVAGCGCQSFRSIEKIIRIKIYVETGEGFTSEEFTKAEDAKNYLDSFE